MTGQFYSVLHYFFHPRRLHVLLSAGLLTSLPMAADIWLIASVLLDYLGYSLSLGITFVSVLLGYFISYNIVTKRLRHAAKQFEEHSMSCFIGSLPAVIYLLTPGVVSLFWGIILLKKPLARLLGGLLIRFYKLEPRLLFSIIKLNTNEN